MSVALFVPSDAIKSGAMTPAWTPLTVSTPLDTVPVIVAP